MNSAEVFISVVMLMVIEIKIIQSLAFREAIRSQHMKKLWTFPNQVGGVGVQRQKSNKWIYGHCP